MHVLIIEDEALLALDLRCFLEELGADSCAVADSEADAIRRKFCFDCPHRVERA